VVISTRVSHISENEVSQVTSILEGLARTGCWWKSTGLQQHGEFRSAKTDIFYRAETFLEIE
jgi:hypothetical protein